MATIRQRSSGKWQAMVRRKGQPPAARSFLNRLDALRVGVPRNRAEGSGRHWASAVVPC
jgi:hypothetical protein